MPVTSGMFLFEVVVEKVNSLVESRYLVIRSDFADIFSLELRDPKQMHIVMPEPLPPPPDPPGKKKKKPKPKPKKGKKGKEIPPPPEPIIQSGQSVLFGCTAEFLIENMLKCPLEVSLWNKEDNPTYIGSVSIPWDPMFIVYLRKICNCEEPNAVTLREEYNIFEEGVPKMMAKIGMQVKLSFLNEKVTASFRTLSEDANIRKCLYTGMNSKTTSFMCTLKTTDEDFEENCNKIPNQFVVDKPKTKSNMIAYADYKNAPGANLTFFKDEDYCCMGHADKPPDSIYKAAETCPDIDFIVDYVRKIIVSCNDQMRMLTPRPTIQPRVKATDIDRLCYCRETMWPAGTFAEKFRREAQSNPCPLCIDAGKKPEGTRAATFDIANIRGPCGRAECKIARDMRHYLENLVDEDNQVVDINEVIGPCGSTDCTLATRVKEFLRHEGAFTCANTLDGISTQCACIDTMQKQLLKQDSCVSVCSKNCEEAVSDESDSHCAGPSCPYKNPTITKVYNVYYFTVEHDFVTKPTPESTPKTNSPTHSTASSPAQSAKGGSSGPDKFKYCPPTCPSVKFAESATCSKVACDYGMEKSEVSDSKCTAPVCSSKPFPQSPADSDIIMDFKEIYNPCCVKSCDISERVKEFIDSGALRNQSRMKCKELEDIDPCYCDCVCTFKFSNKTTYCAVCGGYECLGDDTRDLPAYARPHPCPVYHKLYDKKYIKTQSPWPDEEQNKEAESPKEKKEFNRKSSKAGMKMPESAKSSSIKAVKSGTSEKESVKPKEVAAEKPKPKSEKPPPKITTTAEDPAAAPVEKIQKKPDLKNKYMYPPVPKNMGWNWTAEDIPGMKPRPKWKPGAANKILVRRYRAIREGTDIIAKKKRAMMKSKKKIELKPTLIVTKQDGEFTVQMEVFKKYSKERLLHQYPYDEKPPVIYTIGKTPAERLKLQKQRDRKARRETRRKSRLLQSTFRDRCQEICLKAYNQAIGLLPLPNPNNPECPCMTNANAGLSPLIDSCSCSDEGTMSSSDSDHDEWVIEFTPPMARWDAKAKHPPVLTDNESQYNYMDYKVKVLDKNGNQVPRFFKSHEGKQECSDLGGFWGPGKVWLEINKDGYIGPDERWVPMNFIGPDGMFYSAEEGSFTDTSGQHLKLGVDGYIDKDLNWVWYPKRKQSKSPPTDGRKSKQDYKGTSAKKDVAPSGSQKSGARTSEKGAGDKGIGDAGGKYKKGTSFKPPNVATAPKKVSGGGKQQTVMNVSVRYDNRMRPTKYVTRTQRDRNAYEEHKKIAKYREIIKHLQMYDDLGDITKPLVTTNNRASNTPSKQTSRIKQEQYKVVPSMLYAGPNFSLPSPTCSELSRY